MLSSTVSNASLAASKTILLIGFWPPTNEMLRSFSLKPELRRGEWRGGNWRGSGYDIVAYFPEFNQGDIVGFGDFRVDFASTYNDFQRVTRQHRPIAIIAFGQGAGFWEIENLYPAYFKDWFQSGNIPSTVGTLVTEAIPESLKEDTPRYSSLPVREIRDEVNLRLHSEDMAWVDERGSAGDYLCGFLGYLSTWYRDTHSDPADPYYTAAAGFIHVAQDDTPRVGIALEGTLQALVNSLKARN